jgi:hypothetical protein
MTVLGGLQDIKSATIGQRGDFIGIRTPWNAELHRNLMPA